jgi:hypothetical protein
MHLHTQKKNKDDLKEGDDKDVKDYGKKKMKLKKSVSEDITNNVESESDLKEGDDKDNVEQWKSYSEDPFSFVLSKIHGAVKSGKENVCPENNSLFALHKKLGLSTKFKENISVVCEGGN